MSNLCFHKINPKSLQTRIPSNEIMWDHYGYLICTTVLSLSEVIVKGGHKKFVTSLILSGSHAWEQLFVVMSLYILALNKYCCGLLLIYTFCHSSCHDLLLSLSSGLCNSSSWDSSSNQDVILWFSYLLISLPNCSTIRRRVRPRTQHSRQNSVS